MRDKIYQAVENIRNELVNLDETLLDNFTKLEKMNSSELSELIDDIEGLSEEELKELVTDIKPLLEEIEPRLKKIAKAKIDKGNVTADETYIQLMGELQYLVNANLVRAKNVALPSIVSNNATIATTVDSNIIPDQSIIIHFFFKASTSGHNAGVLLPRHAYFEIYATDGERKSYEFRLEDNQPNYLYNNVLKISSPGVARVFNSWEPDDRYKNYEHRTIVIPCALAGATLDFMNAKKQAEMDYAVAPDESAPRFNFQPISNNCATQVYKALRNANAFTHLKKTDYIDTPLNLYHHGKKLEAALKLKHKIHLLELTLKNPRDEEINSAAKAVVESVKSELDDNMSLDKILILTNAINFTRDLAEQGLTMSSSQRYEDLVKTLPGCASNAKKIIDALDKLVFIVTSIALLTGALLCQSFTPFLNSLAIASDKPFFPTFVYNARKKGVGESVNAFFTTVRKHHVSLAKNKNITHAERKKLR